MTDRKQRDTPESVEFQKFKGKRVRIRELCGREVDGKLVWVDLFTLGQEQGDFVEMVYKHGIMRISPLE